MNRIIIALILFPILVAIFPEKYPYTIALIDLNTLFSPFLIAGHGGCHRWKLPGNCPVFDVVMVIYHYVEIIWRILVIPNSLYNINNNE